MDCEIAALATVTKEEVRVKLLAQRVADLEGLQKEEEKLKFFFYDKTRIFYSSIRRLKKLQKFISI